MTSCGSLITCPEPEARRAACLLGVSWPQSCLQGAGGLAPPAPATPESLLLRRFLYPFLLRMYSGIQSKFWFLRGEILNQLSSNRQGSDRNKNWALLLDIRRFLGLKAKMGSSMPLPSLELGMHRQELGLQSRCYLSS